MEITQRSCFASNNNETSHLTNNNERSQPTFIGSRSIFYFSLRLLSSPHVLLRILPSTNNLIAMVMIMVVMLFMTKIIVIMLMTHMLLHILPSTNNLVIMVIMARMIMIMMIMIMIMVMMMVGRCASFLHPLWLPPRNLLITHRVVL